MTATITVKMDNTAFTDAGEPATELARILRDLADRIETGAITVRMAESQENAESNGWSDTVERDTVKEAKELARRVLTAEYARQNEMSQPFGYSQVVCDGEVVYDYFRD